MALLHQSNFFDLYNACGVKNQRSTAAFLAQVKLINKEICQIIFNIQCINLTSSFTEMFCRDVSSLLRTNTLLRIYKNIIFAQPTMNWYHRVVGSVCFWHSVSSQCIPAKLLGQMSCIKTAKVVDLFFKFVMKFYWSIWNNQSGDISLTYISFTSHNTHLDLGLIIVINRQSFITTGFIDF